MQIVNERAGIGDNQKIVRMVSDYYIVFTGLFASNLRMPPYRRRLFNPIGQMAVRLARSERRCVGLQRAAACPDLRGDLQIGGYCAQHGNQTVL